jgi:D-beta-D-heptose 7-phosphate kinase/D-beta-D-heptose 1-phosphate adenosyltransferase
LGRVISQDELILERDHCKRDGKRIVFVSGVFDLLHPGHIRLLEQARDYGDVLIVAVQSDRSVRAGQDSVEEDRESRPARPITPATERAEILAALRAVDYVVEFEGTTPAELLRRLLPDVVAKSSGVPDDEAVRREEEAIQAAGGTVVRIPAQPGYSTSLLIERIRQLRA